MNIFSNIGITELILILLLALLVVGPERLPELGQKLGKALRDLRKAYDNLTKDLGPELSSIQKSTQDLRESVESVRSIPRDMVKTIVDAADLDDTVTELKGMADEVSQVGETISAAGKTIKDPMAAAVGAARGALTPPEETEPSKEEERLKEETGQKVLAPMAAEQITGKGNGRGADIPEEGRPEAEEGAGQAPDEPEDGRAEAQEADPTVGEAEESQAESAQETVQTDSAPEEEGTDE